MQYLDTTIAYNSQMCWAFTKREHEKKMKKKKKKCSPELARLTRIYNVQ